MVIIGSPDLANSKVCAEEIAHARNLGKRIIAIECRPIDFASAPPRLKALSVKIKFSGEGEAAFSAALNELCSALDVDVAWHRESARLTTLALRWDQAGRPEDLLLTDGGRARRRRVARTAAARRTEALRTLARAFVTS